MKVPNSEKGDYRSNIYEAKVEMAIARWELKKYPKKDVTKEES